MSTPTNTPTKGTPSKSNTTPKKETLETEPWQDAIYTGLYHSSLGLREKASAAIEKGFRLANAAISKVQNQANTLSAKVASLEARERHLVKKLTATQNTNDRLLLKIGHLDATIQSLQDEADDKLLAKFDAPVEAPEEDNVANQKDGNDQPDEEMVQN
ncbi:uncharacterized protein LOC135497358 [Lineus longissimus]|uniref:uncharacterized protein LOC135497358 n=1 Tax=Lineus longissimus TaxID=88925 RepID=UPI00315D5E34